MRWIVLICFLLVASPHSVLAESLDARDVEFEKVEIPNGTEAPLRVGIWYPKAAASRSAGGRGWPLILMSHGGGGSYDAHVDTALALARAGFVAAAVSHAGDTFDDQSKVLQLWRRPAQLRRLADYMLNDWPRHRTLDAARVGAFGFSNGGFTVLVAVGGVPRLSEIGSYCEIHPDHDLCAALSRAGVEAPSGADVPPGAWRADLRIKAAVIAAPAFGFAFDASGLSGVHVPIQIWRAESDRHQPDPFYEEEVRAALPRPPEYRVVDRAGHYDFLPPCSARMSRALPAICTSLPGFDRQAFHERFNAEVVRFFRANL
jgi:predicted dienelactone hydrolase